ncbi:MAG: F0F1 ATP synthase subunit delta [Bacteroidia bacterium]|nr:F0F1 ATP synthase subunit delta [Bacteroidia bacterium]
MNSGIISSRYAKALLKLVDETGNGETVYRQILQVLRSTDTMPEHWEPELQQFIQLLVRNKRTEYIKYIFHTFIGMYNASRGRTVAQLKTAVPAPYLEEKLKEVLEGKLGGELLLEVSVDPDLIGGFVLTIDDKMLDASVLRQIEEIRGQFLDKNKRIV